MLRLSEDIKVYVCLEAVDMRKSINGLVSVIGERFGENPQTGNVFLFCNRRRDKVKGLFWQRNGFFLFYKRLEKGKFKVPRLDQESRLSISEKQLTWLLAGLDFNLMQEFNSLEYSGFY